MFDFYLPFSARRPRLYRPLELMLTPALEMTAAAASDRADRTRRQQQLVCEFLLQVSAHYPPERGVRCHSTATRR